MTVSFWKRAAAEPVFTSRHICDKDLKLMVPNRAKILDPQRPFLPTRVILSHSHNSGGADPSKTKMRLKSMHFSFSGSAFGISLRSAQRLVFGPAIGQAAGSCCS